MVALTLMGNLLAVESFHRSRRWNVHACRPGGIVGEEEDGTGRQHGGAFEGCGITICEVLAVRQGEHGRMPATRAEWLGWGAHEPVRPALAG